MSTLKFLRQQSDPSQNADSQCASARSQHETKKHNSTSFHTQRDQKTIQKCIVKHLPVRKVVSKGMLLPEKNSSDSNTQSKGRLKIAQLPNSATIKKQSLVIQVRPSSKASSRNQDTDIASSNKISFAGSESTSAQSSAKLNKNNYFSKIIPTLNLCSQRDLSENRDSEAEHNSSYNSLLDNTCQFGSLKQDLNKEPLAQNFLPPHEKNSELKRTPSNKDFEEDLRNPKKFSNTTTAKPKTRNSRCEIKEMDSTKVNQIEAQVHPFGNGNDENPFEKVTLPKAVIDLVEENNNLKIENNKKEELIDYLLTALKKQKEDQDIPENATSRLSDILAGSNTLKNKKKITCQQIDIKKFQINSTERLTHLPITTRVTRDIMIGGQNSNLLDRKSYSVRGRSQESARSQERFSELPATKKQILLMQDQLRSPKLPTLEKMKSLQNISDNINKPSSSPVVVKGIPSLENSPFVFHSRNTPLSLEQLSSFSTKNNGITPNNAYGFQDPSAYKKAATRKPKHLLPTGNGIINIFCNQGLPSPYQVKPESNYFEADNATAKWQNINSKAAFDFNGTFNPERCVALAENSTGNYLAGQNFVKSNSKKELQTLNPNNKYFTELYGNDKENEVKIPTLIPSERPALAENVSLGNLLKTRPALGIGKTTIKINKRINSQSGADESSLASMTSRQSENSKRDKFPKEVFTLNIRKKFF